MVSDSYEKAKYFNFHFVAHCTLVNNESTLLDLQLKSNPQLNDFTINGEDILVLIRKLD